MMNNSEKEKQNSKKRKILIPVDFSDYSQRACKTGIEYASRIGAEVMLLHVCFITHVPSSFPYIVYEMGVKMDDEESTRLIRNRVGEEIDKLCTIINRQMDSGELPRVAYNCTIREGIPEKEIAAYIEEYHPTLIIMGTREKTQKNTDMIGSVTGEVIEVTKYPLLAIPENVAYPDLQQITHVGFATSFDQRDLFVFKKYLEILQDYDFNIHLFNISTSKNEWNEIRLIGFCEYLKKQYPSKSIDFTVLNDGDLFEAIEAFVKEKQIDLLTFGKYKRNPNTRISNQSVTNEIDHLVETLREFKRVFNPSIARRMLFYTNVPLLVIPV